MSTKKRQSGSTAYLVVTFADIPQRWSWGIQVNHASGQQSNMAACSIADFPTEHDARADGWAIYQALRRGEGDRKKWGPR